MKLLALLPLLALNVVHQDLVERFQPEKTWLVVVGALESKQYTSFPKTGRRDQRLVETLKSRGVPDKQILLLQDAGATLKQVLQVLEKFYAKAQPDHLLIFYFCGHGYLDEAGRGHLALYDKPLSITQLINAIELGYKGYKVFIALDSPRSSELIRELNGRRTAHHFAAVASSSSSQLNSTRWTFTDALIDVFKGTPCADQNGDGQIDLRELCKFLAEDVEIAEEQLVSYTTQGDFRYDFIFSDVAYKRSNRRQCERVTTAKSGGMVARIVSVEGDLCKLDFLGTDENDATTVQVSELMPVKPVSYEVGRIVEVNWRGGWYLARILQVRGGIHQVHYEGYSKVWDEWVSSRRIRPRQGEKQW
ncbi:MAG: Tudor-knot domain-containing protein [Acidobacteriota bacterium]|nr:caspase family protein [Blastocatellia bacterium]MDW8411228.1 Tudor-knot domain-containing protein [Acidobacteriota bacterium]